MLIIGRDLSEVIEFGLERVLLCRVGEPLISYRSVDCAMVQGFMSAVVARIIRKRPGCQIV